MFHINRRGVADGSCRQSRPLRCRPTVEQLEERCAPAGDFFAVGADAGSRPQVTVFDSAGTPLTSFNAFPPTFSGGVRVSLRAGMRCPCPADPN